MYTGYKVSAFPVIVIILWIMDVVIINTILISPLILVLIYLNFK